MGKALMIPTNFDRFRARVYMVLRWPYAVTGLVSYAFIILLVLAYVNKAPVYKSEFSLVLPGTGESNNVHLSDVGQVTSQTTTPFTGGGFNPLINYKEIVSGRGVLESAAIRLQMDVEDFTPKVLVKEQTSIIEVSIKGASPELAAKKANAIYEAFQDELGRLRADESRRHDDSVRSVLEQYHVGMAEARKKIAAFQQQSVLVSTTQLGQLANTQSTLRDKKLNTSAQNRKLQDTVQQLSLSLGVSPAFAGQAFALQTDAEYRGYLQELDASATQLSEYSSRWGDKHPKVKAIRERYEHARMALLTRSRNVLGVQSGDLLYNIDLQASPSRAQLFSQLISSFAELKGSEAELQALEHEEEIINDKLRIYARESAELEQLEHDFQLAEAVYTSAAARLDASKADIFASYPVVQLMIAPSHSVHPDGPHRSLGIAAAISGCFFITLALFVLWQRKYLINLLLKKS